MHNALPPYLVSKESARSVASGGEKWSSSKNRVVNRVELDPDTEIRLIRANCLRLVTDFNAEVDVVANEDKDKVSTKIQHYDFFFAILKMGKTSIFAPYKKKFKKLF